MKSQEKSNEGHEPNRPSSISMAGTVSSRGYSGIGKAWPAVAMRQDWWGQGSMSRLLRWHRAWGEGDSHQPGACRRAE